MLWILYNFNQFLIPMWLWHTWWNCHFITLSGGLWQGPNFVRWSKFWPNLLYSGYMWQIIFLSALWYVSTTRFCFIRWLCHMWQMNWPKLYRHPLNQNILFCDVKAIKIIVTQMGVQNLGINSVFVLFTSDKSIENVSTYHKNCENSAYMHLMCT